MYLQSAKKKIVFMGQFLNITVMENSKCDL